MNLLYLAPWFPYPLDTGSRTRIYYLLRGLAERHRVTLLTLDAQGWAPAQVEAVAPLCEDVAIVHRDPFQRSLLRQATRFFSMRPVVAYPFPEMMRLAQERHSKSSFDVVIAGTQIMAPYALAIAGVQHVLEEHNSSTRWMRERHCAQTSVVPRLRCFASWRKSAQYEARLFSRFNLVTMVSDQDRKTARALLRKDDPPVLVVPNGVDCQHLRPGLARPEPDTIVFSGALTYQANYEAMQFFLDQVYPMIRAQRPGVRLRVTGATRGVDLNHLRLDESVTLTGFVDDVRPEIARAWVSVAPIRTGGGTRIKILEAMALGTPVVSTKKGAEGLDLADGPDGQILLADAAEAFGRRILELLDAPEMRQQLATRARQLVEERYDWADIGRRFAAAVESTAETAKVAHP